MPIAEELAEQTPERETMLTIGVFDGVHLGHQHLIGKLKERAAEKGLSAGVITFRSHPDEVLRPQVQRTFLTTLEERSNLIRSLGIEFVAVLSFTKAVAQLSARQFVSLLKEHLRMQGLVLGPDFALGRGREGDISALKALGQELNFTVISVPHLKIKGQVVSSTLIRDALSRGDLSYAARLLGRNFGISGEVVSGDDRGKKLGFPTANIVPGPTRALPADGVYATWARVGNKLYKSATNVGVSPTFGGGERRVEAFLIDFNGDLYGQELTIEFVQRIREEVRFATIDQLRAQMDRDVQQAKAMLK